MDTLENLSKTSSYFDQMIAGRFLTSINFPFSLDFISEVLNTGWVEKKPLLKLRCKKSKDRFKIFPDMPDEYSEPNSLHKIILDNSPDMTEYPVLSQMSLLSLQKLRGGSGAGHDLGGRGRQQGDPQESHGFLQQL